MHLRSLRLSRGFDSVNEYLRKYSLPITAAYYRDLESGRKSIGIDTAEQICHALDADMHAFYYNLLSDVIPLRVIDNLVPPESKDVDEKDEGKVETYHTYAWDPARTLQIDSETAKFFENNIELLNSALFICGNDVHGVTVEALQKFLHHSNIPAPLGTVIGQLKELGVIKVSDDSKKLFGTKRWINYQPFKSLRKKWLMNQIRTSLKQKRSENVPDSDEAFVRYGYGFVKTKKLLELQESIEDWTNTLTQSAIYPPTLEDPPCFIYLLVASCPEMKTYD
jgi:hypothetical protein